MDCKIVWTVHNVIPHEQQTQNDIVAAQYLAAHADAKIAHSDFTIKQMDELQMDTTNVSIIPHGSYIGVYPELMTREQARRRLGIRSDENVILFFGLVRPYKGIDNLLDIFSKLEPGKTRLLIVGRCSDYSLKKEIVAAQQKFNIDFHDQYVPDGEVANYFIACDVVCLPFKSVTTSGSTLLALSFGKPLIAPRFGALLDLPSNVGYLYDPSKEGALEEQLKKALANPKELLGMSKAAREYARKLSWKEIACETYKLYEDVLSQPRVEKS